mmetsp:Transcript_25039/g.73293  ORF Transcript_25039/g.73293 Transcript_25039/m.73293 type:complete len:227 (+) Transcript_25039:3363-4043(+)
MQASFLALSSADFLMVVITDLTEVLSVSASSVAALSLQARSSGSFDIAARWLSTSSLGRLSTKILVKNKAMAWIDDGDEGEADPRRVDDGRGGVRGEEVGEDARAKGGVPKAAHEEVEGHRTAEGVQVEEQHPAARRLVHLVPKRGGGDLARIRHREGGERVEDAAHGREVARLARGARLFVCRPVGGAGVEVVADHVLGQRVQHDEERDCEQDGDGDEGGEAQRV